jgi:hypothetical protein
MSYWVETKDGPRELEIPVAEPVRVASFHDIVVKKILDQLESDPSEDASYAFDWTLIGKEGKVNIEKIKSICGAFSSKGYVTQIDYTDHSASEQNFCEHDDDSHASTCLAILWVSNVKVSSDD